MSLEKKVEIDLIEVTKNYHVQVREKTTILDNGVEISDSLRRWVVYPGMDYSDQDPKVIKICQALHTEEVVNEYLERVKNSTLSTID
jgi:hypothetical protein